ncbi:MAG: hypothetical protein BroJett040_09020 [Oligoflexia bacterium]|nr:MAG: hypothetical protein BroJett040_09020 [Oligoflexia bacterium]
MKTMISKEIINECRQKLILMKQELLNRMRGAKLEVSAHDKMSGDEVDQMVAQQTENNFVLAQNRIRTQLIEIEMALARIQSGQFGICEETEEPIEAERLLAIPYTRLSIEGAEMRDALAKKYAR